MFTMSPPKQLDFPSSSRLFAYCLISLLLTATASTSSSILLQPRNVILLIFISSIVYLAIKFQSLLNERLEARQVFIQGRVPMLESENLLSGNLFSLVRRGNNLDIIDSHHARLGKTFGVFFGPDPWVFTTELELIHRLFSKEGNKYVDVTQFRLPYLTEMNTSLAQVQGDEWRRIRRLLNPSFTAHQMKSDNVYRDIHASCSRLINEYIQAHHLNDDGSRIVDIQYGAQKFTAEVILKVAYGQENVIDMDPEVEDELIEAIREAAKVVLSPVVCLSIIFGGGVQYLFGRLAKFTAIGKYLRHIHDLMDESLRSRLGSATQVTRDRRRMIDTIIECVKTGGMDEQTLRANMFFIFVGGFDTTANTLTCLFWLLSKNQLIQDKLRDSIASSGGEKSDYLDWCIKETLRIYPAVPTAIGRVLSDDITFGEKKFFKGTTINASIFSIHRSSEYWGPDVLEFRPERFDEQRYGHLHPAQYMPFALGPRVCIGHNLAMAEMKALVSCILLRYKLEISETTTPRELTYTSTNLVHMIIDGPVKLRMTEISSL